jgi:uncharacterized membrane protein
MAEAKRHGPFWRMHIQGNLITGLLTIIPLAVVWFVFNFLLNLLSAAGRPLAVYLTDLIDRNFPDLAPSLASASVRWIIGVVVALLILYLIGAVVSRVAGQRALRLFERVIARIPMVETVYSAAKQLIDVLRAPAGGGQRVVLVDFPKDGMKSLGFVMKSFADAKTGEELAAVYIPTAINPTNGFLEIMPMASLMLVDIPPDQAMTMIISGGAVAPAGLSVAEGKR